VLDEQLEPVPIGVIGELYVGGLGLARGYLNRPGLTAQQFIANPFANGDRLYRTGDRVRYRSDGNLEFIGRSDEQVKLRGYRIELGEIESALLGHEGVQQAVVVVREEEPGEKRLVGYVVSADTQLDVSELKARLKQRLPGYMMPSVIVRLDALPLTTNGKVDHKALPAPEGRTQTDTGYVAPRTPMETTLASIWCEVLRLDQVGAEDNFFDLGGDSIQSIRIVARANQLGIKLTVRQMFDQQTLAGIASVARAAVIVAEQTRVTGEVPLTPIQHWYLDEDPAEAHHFNQAFVLGPARALSAARLEQALGCLLGHHDALRLRFIRESGGWRQVHAEESSVRLECLDFSRLTRAEQEQAFRQCADRLQVSLDLSQGPLLRAALFELSAGEQRLLLIIHHLVVDGVSWRVLLEDLRTVYEQLEAGEPVRLPAKTSSFKHWSSQLQSYAQSDALQHEAAYWQALEYSNSTRLPVDHADGLNTVGSMRALAVSLSESQTEALLYEVPQVYHTQINDVLMTALAQALQKWTGGWRHTIALEGHGREDLFEQVDLSRTVGWFTSVFPVLLELTPECDAGDALKAVKEQLRAIPQRGIGYGIWRYLSRRELSAESAPCEPQLAFNYLGQLDQDIAETGLFRPVRENAGAGRSAHGHRKHLLEVNAMVTGGRLLFVWNYSGALHEHATIEKLAQEYIGKLQALLEHCQLSEGGRTLSDFPLLNVTIQ
jgi:non-ribosomal peptide synthase protein (TIGR01720 family)